MKNIFVCALLFMASMNANALVLIEMYGDSTTAGCSYVYAADGSKRCVGIVSELQSKYQAAQVVVKNKGVSGLDMMELYWGTAGAGQPWDAQMANSWAQIVTINLGINDTYRAGETDAEDKWYIDQLITIGKKYGKTVIVETSNPIDTPMYPRNMQIAHIVADSARRNGVLLVDHHQLIHDYLYGFAAFIPDGSHPDASLYRFKAANLYRVVDPVVKAILASQQ